MPIVADKSRSWSKAEAHIASPRYPLEDDPSGVPRLDQFHTYNSLSGSNYERGYIHWQSNALEIGTETNGGTQRAVRIEAGSSFTININGSNRMNFATSSVNPGSDNQYSLGTTALRYLNGFFSGHLGIGDGITAPSATVGLAKLFVDSADGDLKVIFGDGTVKTISADT